MKEFSLDTMDGYQFQEFVANLFSQLGFTDAKLGPRGADEGIDITMEQTSDIGVTIRYLVECKHHPESAIGRPVVQKLHSVVVSTPTVDKGMIVTSGHFSDEAIKYAEEVGIELMDGEKLKQLARKVGTSVLSEPLSLVENCFPISNKPIIKERLLDFLKNDVKGFNENLAEIIDIGLRLIPAYMVDYSINATFSTSVGIIRSINESSSFFLRGDTGEPFDSIITDVLLPFSYNISEIDQGILKDIKTERISFVKTRKEIKEPAIDSLQEKYTEAVSYTGANNVQYVKQCVPSKRDIRLSDIQKVYIPIWNFLFSMLKNKYVVAGVETPSRLNILPSYYSSKLVNIKTDSDVQVYPGKCMICSKALALRMKFVCNDCGKITCSLDNFQCKVCGKVVCKEHAIFKRKFLVLSEKYCSQCAPK